MRKLTIILLNLAIANLALGQSISPAPPPDKTNKDQSVVGVKVGLSAPIYPPMGFSGLPYNPAAADSLQILYYRKLEKKEYEINADYAKRIKSVQIDEHLTQKEKRKTVRALKHQRDKDLYYMIAHFNNQLTWQRRAGWRQPDYFGSEILTIAKHQPDESLLLIVLPAKRRSGAI